MMKTGNTTRGDLAPTQRVLAWWDVDVDIGAFHKRKLTSRPLRQLERALGHRVHVESRWRYQQMPPNVWKFEAFHYLDTAEPALAAYSMLAQLSQISGWFGMSAQGFNRQATTASGEPDNATICAFYWRATDQFGMPRYVSSGVLLRLVDVGGDVPLIHYDRRDRLCRLARPVVQLPVQPELRADYLIEFTAHIVCSNKQDLMGFHLPRFQAANWPEGVSEVEVDALTHAGKPNIIRVRETLHQVCAHEAIARCLGFAQSLRIRLHVDNGLRLVGEQYPGRKYSDGIASFVMTRI
jgi:hypothetical protein